MPGRGRAGSVQVLEMRVLLRGSAAIERTISGATCALQLLVEVCTQCPLGPCLGRLWLASVWRVRVLWPPGLDKGVGDVPRSVVGGVATQFAVHP